MPGKRWLFGGNRLCVSSLPQFIDMEIQEAGRGFPRQALPFRLHEQTMQEDGRLSQISQSFPFGYFSPEIGNAA